MSFLKFSLYCGAIIEQYPCKFPIFVYFLQIFRSIVRSTFYKEITNISRIRFGRVRSGKPWWAEAETRFQKSDPWNGSQD